MVGTNELVPISGSVQNANPEIKLLLASCCILPPTQSESSLVLTRHGRKAEPETPPTLALVDRRLHSVAPPHGGVVVCDGLAAVRDDLRVPGMARHLRPRHVQLRRWPPLAELCLTGLHWGRTLAVNAHSEAYVPRDAL